MRNDNFINPGKRAARHPVSKWEIVYISALILALIALIYTWHDRADADQRLRAEYETYIENCRARCGGGDLWNPEPEDYYTSSPDSWQWPDPSSPDILT